MPRAPYYVSAPPYVQTSAGIRVLYKLVQELRRSGEEAWVAMSPYHPDRLPRHLDTPLLTNEIVRSHRMAGRSPIAVYPEVVVGNPLRASAVVRYVMNEPGLLGGPATFPGELVFGYGALLSKAAGFPDNSLFLPAIELEDFPPPPAGKKRDQVLLYASKYRMVHRAEPFGVPDEALEITRDEVNAPDPHTLVELLRGADRIYLYENSALAIEAPLCGCIAVMMPNRHLSFPIGALDHGMGGIAWGDSPEEIARARATTAQMRTDYQLAIERFGGQLQLFKDKTQAFAANKRPGFLDNRPPEIGSSYAEEAASAAGRLLVQGGAGALVRKGFQVLRQQGIPTTFHILVRMMHRG